MNEIAENHHAPGSPGDQVHAALRCWLAPATGLVHRIDLEMRARLAHPARCVVLLPYAQLMPVATALWAQTFPQGFAPRFETTTNWSLRLHDFSPAPTDVTLDMAVDMLCARAMLEDVNLGGSHDDLAPLVVATAHQLAPLAAAVPPAQRPAWAARVCANVLADMQAPGLAMEAATVSIALTWVAQSGFATDSLFEGSLANEIDHVFAIEGFMPDPMLTALHAVWGRKWFQLALDGAYPAMRTTIPPHACRFHQSTDAEDEAQRAATCVLEHLAQGRVPVALVVNDRALTRRVHAMLHSRGVALRDENGWKLSTSHAGAAVMGLIKACAWDASTDAVLQWIKGAPAFDGDHVRLLEAALRRARVRDWRLCSTVPLVAEIPLLHTVNVLRDSLQAPRPLAAWLAALRQAMVNTGLWSRLTGDAAGERLLSVLRLSDPAPASWAALLATARWSAKKRSLAEFTAWVNQVLEAASFTPLAQGAAQVVVLPMSQLLGRAFAAVVMPGCDEVRLNPSNEPPGAWTPAQRDALGLPPRATLEAAMRRAWQVALQAPHCDVLWRTGDDGGEPLLPSVLVQQAQVTRSVRGTAADARPEVRIVHLPTQPPQPRGNHLSVFRLSASAYDDLRHCPYRFFALRQLGLREADELQGELQKRDFGTWLHAVLQRFHESIQAQVPQQASDQSALLDQAAQHTSQALRLDPAEFLPYDAAWPQIRDGYLAWWVGYQAEGASFLQAEASLEQPLGTLLLHGKIDRIDQLPDGSRRVLDYKTEAQSLTRQRINTPAEDTQLAFYAALLPDDTLGAGYVNVGEKESTRLFDQAQVVEQRDQLIASIQHDMGYIAAGAPLPALGQGAACDFCAARGLCRKDFWAAPAPGP